MENQYIVQVEDKVPSNLLVPPSIQHTSAMFDASILVPFISDISLVVVLFMNGVSALLFIGMAKGKASAYLGSSFAFSAPAGATVSNLGCEYALRGPVAVGFCRRILAFIMYKFGAEWTEMVLPPAAMDPVVALIGLGFSDSAAGNIGLLGEVPDPRKTIVFVLTLEAAVFGSIPFRRFFSAIPIPIVVIAGYVSALACGIVDFAEVVAAPVFALPNFSTPKFNLEAIVIVPPVLLVITSEHIGHQVVTSKIVGEDLLKDPDLRRSLFGDNFSIMISGLIGSVSATTYGENIRVMVITRVYSMRVITGTAVLSIVCFFVGKSSTFISTIPDPVIGGVSFLLYGMIETLGLRILVDFQVDCGSPRNLAPASAISVTGLLGATVKFGNVQLASMMLTYAVGMILSLASYVPNYFKLTNGR